MLTQEEMRKINEILRNVQEINGVVREIKLWRKFIVWSFGIVTAVIAIFDFAKLILGVVK